MLNRNQSSLITRRRALLTATTLLALSSIVALTPHRGGAHRAEASGVLHCTGGSGRPTTHRLVKECRAYWSQGDKCYTVEMQFEGAGEETLKLYLYWPTNNKSQYGSCVVTRYGNGPYGAAGFMNDSTQNLDQYDSWDTPEQEEARVKRGTGTFTWTFSGSSAKPTVSVSFEFRLLRKDAEGRSISFDINGKASGVPLTKRAPSETEAAPADETPRDTGLTIITTPGS